MSRSPTPKPEKDHTSRLRLPWKKKVDPKTVVGAASVILAAITPVLQDLSGVASHVGIPAAKFGITCISQVLKRAEQMSATKERVETLRLRISKLSYTLQAIEGPKPGGRLPVPIQKRLETFAQEWDKIEDDADQLVKAGALERFADSQQNADKVSQLVDRISESIHNLSLHSLLSTELHVLDMHSMMVENAAKKEEALPFRHAMGARYDQNDTRGKCLDNTRVDFLRGLRDWIRNGNDIGEGNGNGAGKLILWLNGVAGSGKTTIACDMAEWCDGSGRLVASFFCARSEAECGDVGLIVSTIVRQLCSYSLEFKNHVLDIVRKDDSILQAGIKRQIKELLAQPFEKMHGALRDKVIIIDALDECKDKAAVSTLLDTLLPYLSSGNWPKIIITSRPEGHIRKALEGTATKHILHEVPVPIIEADITTYLDSSFRDMRASYELPEEWPGDAHVKALMKLSGGLFVIASTAFRLISESGEPSTQLERILETKSQGIVDDLYEQIARDAASNVTNGELSNILGALVVLQRPLSAGALSALLGLHEVNVRRALADLHSVLLVPKGNQDPIRFFHPTFPEFLVKTVTSSHTPAAFHVKTQHSHLYVLQRSLEAMRVLKRDIIGIQYPGTLLKEIHDLWRRVSAVFSPQLDYACRHWDAHLCALPTALISDASQALYDFASHQLLYWLEACALLGIYHYAIGALDASERAYRGAEHLIPDTALLVADCRRLALTYIDVIRDAPLQLYHFALAVAPRSSILMRMYGNLLENSVVVSEGAEGDWGPCISSFAGHGGKWVSAVAFSPDGASFATSGNDAELKIWRTLTCELLLSIDHWRDREPDFSCQAIAFSPDGTHIISTIVCKLQIWDTSTGNHIRTISTDNLATRFVSYGADGRHIIASSHSSVCVWDPAKPGYHGQSLNCRPSFRDTTNLQARYHNLDDRNNFAALPRHTSLYSCPGRRDTFAHPGIPDLGYSDNIVAVCPRLTSLDVAHCTDDGLCLRQFSSATCEVLQLPGNGSGIAAISPDGCYVAAIRCKQGAILHIWTLADKQSIRLIHIPDAQGHITYIAFSPDSSQIACGDSKGRVLVWLVSPESATPRIFSKHNEVIVGISWSPVDSTLVSIGGGDVCVWDTTVRSRGETVQPSVPAIKHNGPPRVVTHIDIDTHPYDGTCDVTVFNLPSPSPFASCNDIRLPGDSDGALALTLHDDTASAWLAASKVLHGFWTDRLDSACLWASFSGTRTICSGSRSSSPRSIVSENAELLAYAPSTGTSIVKVHNLRSGATVATLAGHHFSVKSIAFSPDSTRVACSLGDASVRIWSLNAQTEFAHCTAHLSTTATHIVFSPNGRLVAAVSDHFGVELVEVDDIERNGVEVLNVDTGRNRTSSSDLPSGPREILFTPDGTHIAGRTKHTLGNPIFIWEFGQGNGFSAVSEKDNYTSIDKFIIDNAPLWTPKAQQWPRYLRRGDWIHAIGRGATHRVIRLPPGFRLLPSFGEHLHLLDRPGRVLTLDMSRILTYIDSL